MMGELQSALSGSEGLTFALLGLIFCSVFMLVLGTASLLGGRPSLKDRVAGEGPRRSAAARDAAVSLRYADDAGNLGRVLAPVTRRLVPTNMTEVSATRLKLIQAGYSRPAAIGVFYAARVTLALLLPLLFLPVAPIVGQFIGSSSLFGVTGVCGLIGLYLPNFLLKLRTSSLQEGYRRGFPDALDLLIVSVEAGLGLDAAITRVGQELASAHRELGENLQLVGLELRAGTARSAALRNLSDRLGIDEVRALVTLLNQSELLGTSIADSLRIYSEEMRAKRMLTAEIKANALPVKLSIPLVLFVFPVIMTVIMLPVVIRIVRQVLTVKM
jgi:tight adherence protein C